MSNFQIKDFTSGLAVKIRTFFVNTDEAVAVHSLVDTANGEILGTKTDAKNAATDATSVSIMSVFKQISASVQALVTALGSTAFDLGQGTGGSRTLRVAVDSAQLDGSKYEAVAASVSTPQVLGGSGATGDFISKVVIVPETTTPGAVTLYDGVTSYIIFVGGASSVSNLVPFTVDLGMYSISGPWKLTTGANVHAFGVGNFT